MDESHRGGSRGTLPWYYCCAKPLLGRKGLSEATSSLGKKNTSQTSTGRAISPARCEPEFRLGNRLQASKPTPRHPGPAASQALRDSFTKAGLQAALSRQAGSASRGRPFPKAAGTRSRAPRVPGLTAESRRPAQPEAHGGHQSLPPHLASRRHTQVSARKEKKKKKKLQNLEISKCGFYFKTYDDRTEVRRRSAATDGAPRECPALPASPPPALMSRAICK